MLQPSAEIPAVYRILRISCLSQLTNHIQALCGKNANISKPELFPTLATVPQQDKERGDFMNNQQPCTAFIT